MPEMTVLPVVESLPVTPVTAVVTHWRRLLALSLVLSLSFTHFVVAAFYSLFQTEKAVQQYHTQIGVFTSLLAEVLSLALLWFVLSEHKRSWAEIGWSPQWMDLFHGIGLIVGMRIASGLVTTIFQGVFRNYTGHYMQPRSGHGLLDAGFSLWTALLVVINPFFEELIVRGYTMSEIMALGGSRNLAIFLSVLIQMSYHVYQGLLRCIALAAVFLVFSVYFSRTRRIAPVIVAHFWSDARALIHLAF